MAEEIDKDLTMIQPPQDLSSLGFEELMKHATASGSVTAPVTDKKSAEKYIGDMQSTQRFDSSVRQGTVDPELDAGQSMFESTESARARNQSAGIKGLKAVGGGIYQGALLAMEQMGYVADIDSYTNMFDTADGFSGNWWTQLMNSAQEKGRESDMFKIYEEQGDENKVMSQIFKWNSLEGAISSAVGFGLPGLGAAKFVSYLGATKGIKGVATYMDDILGNVTKSPMGGATQAFVGPFAASAMTNYFMGQLMASETYDDSMRLLQDKIAGGEMTELEAQTLANDNAQDVVSLNMGLMLTAHIKFKNIFTREAKINGLVKNPTMFNEMKRMIVQGSPTSFAEEVSQELMQMEQLHDVSRVAGIDSEYTDNTWDRMVNMALSNRAIHAGALGITGGPLQFAMIQRPFMSEQIRSQKEAYRKQTELMDWRKEVVKNNFTKFKDYDSMMQKSVLEGNAADANFIGDMSAIDSVADFLEWGIADFLVEDFTNVKNMSTEEAIAAGHNPETYVADADRWLSTIAHANDVIKKYPGVVNRGEVTFNRMATIRAAEELLTVKETSDKAQVAVLRDMNLRLQLKDVNIDENFKVVRDANRFDSIKDNAQAVAKLKLEERQQDRDIDNFLANSFEYEQYTKTRVDVNKYIALLNKLDARFTEITHPDYQKNIVKKESEAAKDIKTNLQTSKDQDASNKAEEASVIFRKFSEVEQGTRVESEEERRTRMDTFKENISKDGRSLRKPDSFSSIDYKGVHRVYTPGDIVVSQDGRLYKVKEQLKGYKGNVDSSMPILYEVDDKGKLLKSPDRETFASNLFVLGNNEFLRPEVLQEAKGQNGPIFGYSAKWASYVVPDSLLRPNNSNYQAGRLHMLTDGNVKTVNLSARAIKAGEHAWTEEYAMDTFNKPFSGDYEVYFKMRNEGEGRKYIDVYKKGEGTEDVLLTRVDKDYNINYTVITDALAKGTVTGKVVGHYTSSKNLVLNTDVDGNKVYTSIAEVRKMNPEYLPNGKVMLAQTKGTETSAELNVAVDEDGKVYTERSIEVIVDGKAKMLEVPFDTMTPGDTYFLLVAPNGQYLMPVATTTKSVHEITTDTGTYTDTIIKEFQNTINTVFKDQIENRDETDKILYDTVNNDITIKDADRKYKFAAKKFAMLNDAEGKTRTAFKEHLKGTVLSHIREVPYKTKRVGYVTVDGIEKKIKVKHAKGEGVYEMSENYFELTYAVSAATGNIVPAVMVRKDRNHGTYHKTKNPDGGAALYNLEDHAEKFMEIIGSKRKKMSIYDLQTPIKEDGTNFVKDLIDSGEVTTDLNLKTPFLGASATIKVDGGDIITNSITLLEQASKAYEKKFKSELEANINYVTAEKEEDRKEDFTHTIEEFLNPTEDNAMYSIEEINKLDSEDDVLEEVLSFIETLGLKHQSEAKQLAKDIFNSTYDDLDAVKISEIKETLENKGLNRLPEHLPKAVFVIQEIQELVNTGKYTLKNKIGRKHADPKLEQLEGFSNFPRGTKVYSPVFGIAEVLGTDKQGRYEIKTDKRTRAVTVYPAELFIFDGMYHQSIKIQRELDKLKDGDPRKDVLIRKKDKLLNDLEYRNKRRKGISTGDKVKADDGTITSDTNFSLVNFYSDTLALQKDGITDVQKDFLTTIDSSNRGYQLKLALSPAHDILEDVDILKDTTTEKMELVYNAARNVILYTDNELEKLLAYAQEKGISPTEITAIKKLILLKKALDGKNDLVNSSTVNLPKFKESSNKEVFTSFDLPGVVIYEGPIPTNTKEMVVVDLLQRTANFVFAVTRIEAGLNAAAYAPKGVAVQQLAPTSTQVTNTTTLNTTVTPPPAPVVVTNTNPLVTNNSVIGQDVVEKLTPENLAYITTLSKEAQEDLKGILDVSIMAGVDVNFIVDNMIQEDQNVPFKRGEDVTLTQDEFDVEVSRAKAMLPQVPIEVVASVTTMVNKYGVKALGAFDKGVRVLVNRSESGTAYHETFHSVADLYLTLEEKVAIAKEKGKEVWNIELEEQLAEEFEAYAKEYFTKKPKTILGRVGKFFQNLIDWVRGTRTSSITEKIFEKTVTGGYANSPSIASLNSTDVGFNNVEEFSASLSENNNVLLQDLFTNNRIKITC